MGGYRVPPKSNGDIHCTTCREFKPKIEFYIAPSSARGYSYNCRECAKDIANAWHRENKGPVAQAKRRRNTLKAYGLTPETYELLLRQQGWACAICDIDSDEKQLAVDHDHETGEVRGLLCGSCNGGMGLFKDRIDLLERAIHYLKAMQSGEIL